MHAWFMGCCQGQGCVDRGFPGGPWAFRMLGVEFSESGSRAEGFRV